MRALNNPAPRTITWNSLLHVSFFPATPDMSGVMIARDDFVDFGIIIPLIQTEILFFARSHGGSFRHNVLEHVFRFFEIIAIGTRHHHTQRHAVTIA